MPLLSRTMTQMLTEATAILTPRSTDVRLTAVERAQCQESINACSRALGRLRADQTVATGQRQATFSDLVDKVHALDTIDRSHQFGTAELYNAMDLMFDAAHAILAGRPTHLSDLG